MFSAEQIARLKSNRKYKKIQGIMNNWQFSRAVRLSKDLPNWIDFSVNGCY